MTQSRVEMTLAVVGGMVGGTCLAYWFIRWYERRIDTTAGAET